MLDRFLSGNQSPLPLVSHDGKKDDVIGIKHILSERLNHTQ
jgi:hypothetical protein